MTTKILAIDPGKLSGVSLLSWDGENLRIIETQELEQMETCSYAEQAIIEIENLHIVMEDFIISKNTATKTDNKFSLHIIGSVMYSAWKDNIPFTLQTPVNAKNFTTNQRLKALNLWHKGGEGHANDSLRHAVLYAVKNLGWRPEGLLSEN